MTKSAASGIPSGPRSRPDEMETFAGFVKNADDMPLHWLNVEL